jgi:uncharacterized protein YbjT (DUF2867 family)
MGIVAAGRSPVEQPGDACPEGGWIDVVAKTILVADATGLIGEPVAQQLHDDGFRVRLLVRDARRARGRLGPDFEYVQGDVEDAAVVERAVAGCTGVHVSLAATGTPEGIDRVEHRGTARMAAAAARHGVARFSYVTGSLVHETYGPKLPEHQAKLRAEQAIQASGVPYTFFRPTYFMDNLPRHIQGRVAVVLGRRQPALHMVAASDFAAMVSRAFRLPEAANWDLFIWGPEAVTIPNALRHYCSLVQPGIRVVTVPLGIMSLADRLVMGGRLQADLQLMGLLQRLGERGDPSEATRLLGAPETTVHQWCQQRAGTAQQGRPDGHELGAGSTGTHPPRPMEE